MKQYIYEIRKHVLATSVEEAIKQEKDAKISEVLLTSESYKTMLEDIQPQQKVGL